MRRCLPAESASKVRKVDLKSHREHALAVCVDALVCALPPACEHRMPGWTIGCHRRCGIRLPEGW